MIGKLNEIEKMLKLVPIKTHMVYDKFTKNILEVDEFGNVVKFWLESSQIAELMKGNRFKKSE